MTDSPASPAMARLMEPPRSPSPCLNLDALSLDESARSGTPVNTDQVGSDDDLPTAMHKEDRRQVVRVREVPPEGQVVDMSCNDQPGDTRWAVWRVVLKYSGCCFTVTCSRHGDPV